MRGQADSRRFWLSFIKIITLTGLILLGLIIDLGGVPGQDRIGFRYWKGDQAFLPYKRPGATGRFLGFFNAMVLALFSYIGTELLGVTVGEAKNPRRTVPAAIKKTFFRILFFYICSILIIGSQSSAHIQLYSLPCTRGFRAARTAALTPHQ